MKVLEHHAHASTCVQVLCMGPGTDHVAVTRNLSHGSVSARRLEPCPGGCEVRPEAPMDFAEAIVALVPAKEKVG